MLLLIPVLSGTFWIKGSFGAGLTRYNLEKKIRKAFVPLVGKRVIKSVHYKTSFLFLSSTKLCEEKRHVCLYLTPHSHTCIVLEGRAQCAGAVFLTPQLQFVHTQHPPISLYSLASFYRIGHSLVVG